jgi:hypothetical protein
MLPGERMKSGDVLHGVSRTKGLRRVRAVSSRVRVRPDITIVC